MFALNAAGPTSVYAGEERNEPVNDAPMTPSEPVADAPHPAAVSPSAGACPRDPIDEVHARRGLLVRLAYRFCWDIHDAEDAVQSALVQATSRREQLADAARAWSWVRAIVVRKCYDLRRRAKRTARAGPVLVDRARRAELPDQAHEVAARSELSEHVRLAIAELPQRQQTAIVLRHLEELSYAEIAEIMAVSESTVRVQVRDARETLRRILKGWDTQDCR
jgi:RNA polymerase sigma-70 factor (ECF subfamily)